MKLSKECVEWWQQFGYVKYDNWLAFRDPIDIPNTKFVQFVTNEKAQEIYCKAMKDKQEGYQNAEVITNNFIKSKNDLIDEIIENLDDNLGRYTECGKVHGGNCVSLADGSCSANLIAGFFSEVKESIEKFKDENI